LWESLVEDIVTRVCLNRYDILLQGFTLTVYVGWDVASVQCMTTE